MRATSLCRALLVLDLAYCAAALFVPDLPGWKMYQSAEGTVASLQAANGDPIDLARYLPKSARDLDEAESLRVARWICAHHRELTPLRFDSPHRHRTIESPSCVDDAL